MVCSESLALGASTNWSNHMIEAGLLDLTSIVLKRQCHFFNSFMNWSPEEEPAALALRLCWEAYIHIHVQEASLCQGLLQWPCVALPWIERLLEHNQQKVNSSTKCATHLQMNIWHMCLITWKYLLAIFSSEVTVWELKLACCWLWLPTGEVSMWSHFHQRWMPFD